MGNGSFSSPVASALKRTVTLSFHCFTPEHAPPFSVKLCVGTVERICPPLVWVHLEDGSEGGTSVVLPLRSQQLFPVGWCGSNGWPLRKPRDWAPPHHPPALSPLRRGSGGAAAPSSSAAATDTNSKKSSSVEAKSGEILCTNMVPRIAPCYQW
ncbi:hypothetical protein HPB51_022298 [Rhipicephalus microplus]|uniref:Uncharacterized protein n=1 Tax=Rhipicephalus microplus TaxID=6941 RepID=A0A9J6DIY1_RHIMP|nr:hypothetical protein HPB51_022298 [Rhipicephalus microplus]